MRLLAITDVHNDLEALEKTLSLAGSIDAILVLGDVGITRTSIDRVYFRLARVGCPVYVIHGNHEEEDDAREFSEKHNLVFVHRSLEPLDDLVVVGYGGDGFSEERPDLDAFAAQLPEGLTHRSIILTHAPPFDTPLDDLDGDHVGDESVRRLIERVRPLVALSGHLHENFHAGGTIGDSIVANPGLGTIITITKTSQGYAVSLKRL
jgi:uncharacterized protein